MAETYEVPAVPYVVLQRHGRTLDAISGCDPARVRASVEKYFSSEGRGGGDGTGTGSGTKKVDLPPAQTVVRPPPSTTADVPPASTKDGEVKENGGSGKDDDNSTETQEQLHNRLGELVKAAPVMLFMKGTPSAPQCGFSRQTVSILREKGIRYGFFNILADDDVRQGLKEYADWPTYPQVWVDGELAGGLDIVSCDPALLLHLHRTSVFIICQVTFVTRYEKIFDRCGPHTCVIVQGHG